jgi:hypothetical protein
MEEIIANLKCNICLDTLTVPVIVNCEHSQNTTNPTKPVCLHCLTGYFKLDRHPEVRQSEVKSPTGCGCDINLRYNTKNIYFHDTSLYAILDTVKKPKCHYCNEEFDSTTSLIKHIKTKCPEKVVKCKLCSHRHKRRIINGYHYDMSHKNMKCDICSKKMFAGNFEDHLKTHIDELSIIDLYKKYTEVLDFFS